MALHSDPHFYTDERLEEMSIEELQGVAVEAKRARASLSKPDQEREAWNDRLAKAADLLKGR